MGVGVVVGRGCCRAIASRLGLEVLPADIDFCEGVDALFCIQLVDSVLLCFYVIGGNLGSDEVRSRISF
ncbi:hypothetical protein VDG1235_1687 [Verrucomicrobiia bacterium DG1235]|nr:hypothetical protein VDG1235_1687 [Verrucomicrobiae bacterium DG1235]